MRDYAYDNSTSDKEQGPSVEEDDKLDAFNPVNDLAAHTARIMSLLKEQVVDSLVYISTSLK